MSEMSKAARAAMKAKASRMGGKGDPKTKVDASSWSPPEMMNTDMKTGMRPLTRRAYRKGGKVIEGSPTAMRADRKQRKGGGRSLVTDLINRNDKKANLAREGGDAHVGGYRKGGRLKRAGGGDSTVEPLKIDNMGASPTEIAMTRPLRERYVSPKDTLSSPSMKGRVAGSYGSSKGDYKSGGDVEQDKKMIRKALRQHAENLHHGAKEDIKLKKGGPAHKGEGGGIGLLDALMPFVSIGKRLIGGKNEGLKSGGRTKKQGGGGMGKKAIPGDAPTRGYGPGKSSTDNYEDMPPPREHIYEDAPRASKYENIDALMKDKGIGGYKSGGGTYYGGTRPTGGRMPKADGGKSDADDYWTYKAASKTPELAEAIEAKAIHPKTTNDEWAKLSPGMRREILRSAQRKGRKDDDDRAEMTRRQTSKTFPNVTKTTSEGDPDWDAMGIKGTGQKAKGGRAGRAYGGRTKRKGNGKTNIVISINAGKPDDQQAMMPKMPTPSPLPVPPIAPPGMGAGMPPMPMPPPGPPPGMPPGMGGPPGMPPMPRKSGGRAYRSYKDMDAGALGGMGRLEKVEIEHGKRVGRLSGGRARSYKDMDAGALGGMGRIEKIAIQKHKK